MAKSIVSLLLLLPFTLLPFSEAHFRMDEPCCRGNPNCYGPFGRKNYDVEAPHLYRPEPEIGGNFPCRGLPAGPSVARYRAGQTISVHLAGSDNHDGGHCQFTLSPDNGRTWVVIRTVIGSCLRGNGKGPYSYDVKLPATTPGGRNIFAWTFVNREGDEEFYMSCADVDVDGPEDGTVTGPELMVFRLPPEMAQGRPYERLGEWKYGGDDGVSRLNARRKITVGRHGIVGPSGSAPARKSTRTSASRGVTGPRKEVRKSTRARPASRPQQRPRSRPRTRHHSEDDNEDDEECEERCLADNNEHEE